MRLEPTGPHPHPRHLLSRGARGMATLSLPIPAGPRPPRHMPTPGVETHERFLIGRLIHTPTGCEDPLPNRSRARTVRTALWVLDARRGDLETSLSLRTRGGIPRDLPDGTLWLPKFDAIAVTALVTWRETARIHRHRETGQAAANEAGGSTEGWSTWFCSSAVGVPGRWFVRCARPVPGLDDRWPNV